MVSAVLFLGCLLSSCGGNDAGPELGGSNAEPSTEEASPEGGASEPEQPGGDGDETGDPEPAPTPVPASSDGPAQNWPEPEIPAEIYEETEEGALAALQYWFDTATYLQLTGDPGPFDSMSSSDCVVCGRTTEQFEEVYSSVGAWHVAGRSVVQDPIASSITNDREIGVLFILSESPAQVYESSGEQVLDHPGDDLEAEASLVFGSDSWQVDEVAFFPDESD
ncbi:hypothetical protein BG28_09960 [Nesterenkonia sp. AN1]|nr:hypothetical protein BG28_09960 [Nesterenkonia sp. AN1]